MVNNYYYCLVCVTIMVLTHQIVQCNDCRYSNNPFLCPGKSGSNSDADRNFNPKVYADLDGGFYFPENEEYPVYSTTELSYDEKRILMAKSNCGPGQRRDWAGRCREMYS